MFLKWLFSAWKKTKSTFVKLMPSAKKKVKSGTYHIVWDGEKSKWLVEKDGVKNPVSDHETKKSALDAGEKIGNGLSTGRLIVHKMDGDVQKSVNY